MKLHHGFRIALSSVLAATLLVACGGGGGSSAPAAAPAPAPVPVAPAKNTITVKGTATAATSSYVTTPAAPKLLAQSFFSDRVASAATPPSTSPLPSARLLAEVVSANAWNCAARYTALFAALPKNVDSNKDGVADTNITDADGVVTFNVDVTGDRSKMINVGNAATIATMLNKDQDCNGVATINLDTNSDGIADTAVDSNGDGKPDYTITSASAVTVAGAQVTMTNTATGEAFTAISGSDGKFEFAGMKTGTYDMDLRAKDAAGKVIWNQTRNKLLTVDGDMGAFGLSRSPILRSVTVDGAALPLNNNSNSITYSSRKLVAGDVVSIKVTVEDPNGLPITMAPFYHAAASAAPLTVSGYTISYTVTAADLALNVLQIGADLNNNDNVFGMDAYRDLFVSVTYMMQTDASDVAPNYNGVIVNGTTYVNPSPKNMVQITTSPVAAGEPIAFTINHDHLAGSTVGAQIRISNNGTVSMFEAKTDSFTIPGSATAGVYAVRVAVFIGSATGKGNWNEVLIPVTTTELPAKLTGLLINGKPYTQQVLHVGDVMSAQVQATDPAGLPMMYSFALIGTPSTVDATWTSNNTLTYTIQAQDVTSQFSVRVFLRNNDSRVDSNTDADAVFTYPVTATL